MIEKKIIRRLGVRLEHLFHWIDSTDAYDSIWDLCCDHGRLGLHLHQRHLNTRVFLVDKVASIMNKLQVDFGHLNDGRLFFKTADAGQLEIATEKRTLVIIAGVGGQNVMDMLDSILARLNTTACLDFMLSPNSHLFELRAFLRAKSFTLIDEAFVTENSFSHEHLWLRYNGCTKDGYCGPSIFAPVSAVGDRLWIDMTDTKRYYLRQLLQHHHRKLINQNTELSKAVIQAYRSLL